MQLDLFPDLPPSIRNGIGGSEIAALFGLSPFLSPEELWRLKTGQPVQLTVNRAQQRGASLEAMVCDLYEELAERRLLPGQRARHPRWSAGVRMSAQTDRTLTDGGVFEAKTTHLGGPRHRTFVAGDVPISWALQLQHYATTLGVRQGVIACLAGPDPVMHWKAEQCELFALPWTASAAIGRLLEEAVQDWYERFVFPVRPVEGPHPRAQELLDLLRDEPWRGELRVWHPGR